MRRSGIPELPPMPSAAHGALATDLRRAIDGQPWHGPSLMTLLEDVRAADAQARPIAGAHTIWELVLHLAAWTDEVARRLGGAAPAEPEAGDWPAMPPVPDERAWRAAQDLLYAAHARVLHALAACPEARLADPVGSSESPALGTGMSHRAMVRGLAQHHAYHGGQVALLKRAVAAR